jgi:CDP-diacylglycerol--glycerol-3-phosphate 3-phosphatidyltransferase
MMLNLAQIRHTAAERSTRPVVTLLAGTRLSPNTLTILGLLLNFCAAGLIATGHLIAGGAMVLFSGALDMLDGALARAKRRETSFGALLDSTFDRLSEAILLLGVLLFCLQQQLTWGVILTFLVLTGSVLVSYVRARSEGLGLSCEVGWFTRPERVVVLALGLFLNQIIIALGILAAFTFVTVIQRLSYVWRQTRRES